MSESGSWRNMNHSSQNASNGVSNRRKRRPAGTPDPDAEVISLSPKTLLESDRYVCEICNQGFRRDQNLQMHRRRHKVPWKLVKKNHVSPQAAAARRNNQVYVCPEEACLHHNPKHALGDLVGIKKHYRRKHSNNKPWVCGRCSKGYAVQSDYKAHLRTCGTRGHSCDCGRVFSRVESFIEHQDSCTTTRRHNRPTPESLHPTSQPEVSSSPTASTSTTPSMEYSDFTAVSVQTVHPDERGKSHLHNLELQLLPSSDIFKPITSEQRLDSAMLETCFVEEAMSQAKLQIELAESEFAKAGRIRQQALADLEKARILEERFIKKLSSTILEVTCHACMHKFQALAGTPPDAAPTESSPMNYVSPAELKLKEITD